MLKLRSPRGYAPRDDRRNCRCGQDVAIHRKLKIKVTDKNAKIVMIAAMFSDLGDYGMVTCTAGPIDSLP